MPIIWKTDRIDGDTVSISDGTYTYYASVDLDIYTLDEAAQKFANTYDHNGIGGDVRCVAEDLNSGATFKFTC